MIRNVLYSAISRASDVVFLLVLVLAARYLGEEQYGRFAFALAFVGLFEFATDFGLRELVIRDVGRHRSQARSFATIALTWKMYYALLTTLLVVGTTLWMSVSPEQKTIILILLAATLFKSFRIFFRGLLIAHEFFPLETQGLIFERSLLLIVGTALLVGGYGLVPFTVGFAAVSLVNMVVFAVITQRATGALGLRRDGGALGYLFRRSVPFWLTAAAMGFYFRIDSVMLSFYRGDAEVGWYNAAYRIIEGLIVFPSILYYAIFPRLSALFGESQRAIEVLTLRGLKYVVAAGVLLGGCGFILAEPLMLMIYGETYVPSGYAFAILSMALPFLFGWSLLVAVLNSIDQARIPFFGLLIGSILNIIANFWLIPRFGYRGASFATVIAEVFLFLFLWIAIWIFGYKVPIITFFGKPLFAGLAGAGTAYFVPWGGLPKAALFALIFVMALFLVGFWDSGEIAFLRKLRTNRKGGTP